MGVYEPGTVVGMRHKAVNTSGEIPVLRNSHSSGKRQTEMGQQINNPENFG